MYKKISNTKKEIKENIKDYVKHKILYKLTKKKALHDIMFVEDMNDNWFIYVIEYKKKSGEITNNSLIIGSDCTTRLNHLLDLGYEIKK